MTGFLKVSEAVGNNHVIILAIGNNEESLIKERFSKIFDLEENRIYCSTPVVPEDSTTLDLLRKNSFKKLLP